MLQRTGRDTKVDTEKDLRYEALNSVGLHVIINSSHIKNRKKVIKNLVKMRIR